LALPAAWAAPTAIKLIIPIKNVVRMALHPHETRFAFNKRAAGVHQV
jgi:hypothetical protein